jgi:hypothetical protein
MIDTTKPTILTDVFQNYAYVCVSVQSGTQMQSAPKTTSPTPQSSKKWFGLVKNCIKFA